MLNKEDLDIFYTTCRESKEFLEFCAFSHTLENWENWCSLRWSHLFWQWFFLKFRSFDISLLLFMVPLFLPFSNWHLFDSCMVAFCFPQSASLASLKKDEWTPSMLLDDCSWQSSPGMYLLSTSIISRSWSGQSVSAWLWRFWKGIRDWVICCFETNSSNAVFGYKPQACSRVILLLNLI